MVIIGLLVGYVAPRSFDHIGKAETKNARAQLDAFNKALAAYRLDTGHLGTNGFSSPLRAVASPEAIEQSRQKEVGHTREWGGSRERARCPMSTPESRL